MSVPPFSQRKRRSRRRHPSLTERAPVVSGSDCFKHTLPVGGQLMPAQTFCKALGIIFAPPNFSTPQQGKPCQSCSTSPSAFPAATAPSSRRKKLPCHRRSSVDAVSHKDLCITPSKPGEIETVYSEAIYSGTMEVKDSFHLPQSKPGITISEAVFSEANFPLMLKEMFFVFLLGIVIQQTLFILLFPSLDLHTLCQSSLSLQTP